MKKYLLTLIALVAITVSVQAQSHSYKALLRTNKEVTFSWGAGFIMTTIKSATYGLR